jgi:hypothetical protein
MSFARPRPFQMRLGGKRPFLPSFPLLLFLLLFFFTACSLLNRENEPDSAAATEGAPQIFLVCSEACASRGQCGETNNGRDQVILGHPDRPAVSDHQLVFGHETAVASINTREETLQIVSTGQQFNHTFYLVTRLDDGRSGWVAGWCVQP